MIGDRVVDHAQEVLFECMCARQGNYLQLLSFEQTFNFLPPKVFLSWNKSALNFNLLRLKL